jgi:dTDP-4-dehydrorhamnose 3,5-epimerase
MVYTETNLAGAFVIDLEKIEDSRGFFAYLFEAKEMAARGLSTACVQVKLSHNLRKGTVRGMHWQKPPAAETKLVRCIRGAVHDVIVDLRKDSPTYLQHVAVELSAENHRALYVPREFAHGYQTLTDGAEVMYHVDEFYAPQHEAGLRFDDPTLRIAWPLPISDMSPKDAAWELLKPVR